jgi:NTP pyrophosphatase (non-canonical NTP hydrolase)
MAWDQTSITRWAVSNFGYPEDLGVIINRAAEEFDEAVIAYYEGDDDTKVAEELADVFIVMCQVCEHLGHDLLEVVNSKMDINAARKWHVKGDGTAQHV